MFFFVADVVAATVDGVLLLFRLLLRMVVHVVHVACFFVAVVVAVVVRCCCLLFVVGILACSVYGSGSGVAVEQLASKSISEVLSEPEGQRLAQVSTTVQPWLAVHRFRSRSGLPPPPPPASFSTHNVSRLVPASIKWLTVDIKSLTRFFA